MKLTSSRRLRIAIIAVAYVSSAVIIISFLEFYAWFFNNELPAYMRLGLAASDNADVRQHFYEAARDACRTYHPKSPEECEAYQLGLLNTGPYNRPLSSAAGVLLGAMAPAIGFMSALKFSIIALAIGGGILAGLLVAVFMLRLPSIGMAALVLTLIAGWVGTRLSHVASLNILLLVLLGIALLTGIAFGAMTLASLYKGAMSRTWARIAVGTRLKLGVQIAGIAACFATGYLTHQLFEGRYPVLYLIIALGLWPILHRALPKLDLLTSGLLTAAVYVAAPAMPFVYEIYLPKGQQLSIAGVIITIAIYRDDKRVYWALPVLLLFDMQNAAQLCALIVVVEGLTAILRGKSPASVVPAALTALVATVVLLFTAFFPFKDTFFNVKATVALFAMPAVLGSIAAAVVLILAARDQRRNLSNGVALDRLFIYAAAVVTMAGLAVVSYGELVVGALFRGVGAAPAVAIVAGTAAMLVHSYRDRNRDAVTARTGTSAAVALATVFLVMSSVRGRTINMTQLTDGIRTAVTADLPEVWQRRSPRLSLDDDIAYFDAENLMSSPLMQYSMIKLILRARIAKGEPEISVFRARR